MREREAAGLLPADAFESPNAWKNLSKKEGSSSDSSARPLAYGHRVEERVGRVGADVGAQFPRKKSWDICYV